MSQSPPGPSTQEAARDRREERVIRIVAGILMAVGLVGFLLLAGLRLLWANRATSETAGYAIGMILAALLLAGLVAFVVRLFLPAKHKSVAWLVFGGLLMVSALGGLVQAVTAHFQEMMVEQEVLHELVSLVSQFQEGTLPAEAKPDPGLPAPRRELLAGCHRFLRDVLDLRIRSDVALAKLHLEDVLAPATLADVARISEARHRIAAAVAHFDGHLAAYDRRVAQMDAEMRRLGKGDRLAAAFYNGLRGSMEKNRRRIGEIYGKRKEALQAGETVLVFLLERQGRYSLEGDTVVFQSGDDKAYFDEWLAVVRAREAEAQKLYDQLQKEAVAAKEQLSEFDPDHD
jgi:hypothetical protein